MTTIPHDRTDLVAAAINALRIANGGRPVSPRLAASVLAYAAGTMIQADGRDVTEDDVGDLYAGWDAADIEGEEDGNV